MARTLICQSLSTSRVTLGGVARGMPAQLRAVAGLALVITVVCAGGGVSAQVAPMPAQPGLQQGGQGGVQQPLQAVAPPAAQAGQRPYVDEALFARDAIAKAIELDEAGNSVESVRILQDIVQREGEQLVSIDTDLWITVRERVHALLLAKPVLREKYVLEQAAQASALLAAGELGIVEQQFAMTPAGLEAMLRAAQLDIEAGRFAASKIMYARAKAHPLAGDEKAALDDIAANLAALQANAQQPRDGMRPRVQPVQAFAPFRSSLAVNTPQTPLRTLALAQDVPNISVRRRGFNRFGEGSELAACVFPTRLGERVFINDGTGIIAADAATLAPLWRTKGMANELPRQTDEFFMMGDRTIDDGSFVAIGSGVAVAALGRPISGRRFGDSRVIAVRVSDGSELWSIEPQWADPRLQESAVRGEPLIDGDVVVIGVRKPGLSRRITSLYLVGLDLFTGEVRYVRSVGSVGTQPWALAQDRVEGGVLQDGYVYRGDELGVFGAFEAHTGRPAWVRSFPLGKPNDPMQSRTVSPPVKAFEVLQPVIIGESVFWIEPSSQGVVQMERATGKVLAARSGVDVGAPRYLVRAGDALVCIGRFSATVLPIDGFATAQPRRLQGLSSEGFVGRAIVSKDEVLLPVASGVLKLAIASLLADAPQQPALPVGGVVPSDQPQGAPTGDLAIVPLTTSGNLLMVEDTSDGVTASHLLVSDVRGVSSFLSWDRAREQLAARMKASPKDPAPALTLLELSLRMGQATDVPALADKVLAMARGLDGTATRQRLFTALADALVVSRRAPGVRSDGGEDQSGSGARSAASTLSQQPVPAIEDKVLLESLAMRLLPAADDAWQRAVAQLELALAQDNLAKSKEATISLQNILLDAGLASVDFALVGRTQQGERDAGSQASTAWGEPGRSLARDIATDMLWSLVAKHGAASYAVFEDQARGALTTAVAAPAGLQRTKLLASIALKYPCASASIDALETAAGESSSFADARLLLGEALTRALRSAGAGAPATQQRIAGLLASLDARMWASEQGAEGSALHAEPMARLLARISRDHPTLQVARRTGAGVAEAGSPAIVSVSELAAQWRTKANARPDRTARLEQGLTEPSAQPARVHGEDPLLLMRGDALPQVLPGWNMREALVHNSASSADIFIAQEPRTKSLAAFARSALTARVEQLWVRPASSEGTIIHTSNDRTLVYWPNDGGVLEAIDNTSGLAMWTSARMRELREKDEQAVALLARWPERFSTPLGGSVRPDDVLIALTPETCTLVERAGFVASFSLADGTLLTSRQSPFAVVYDIDAEAEETSLVATERDGTKANDAQPPRPKQRVALSGAIAVQPANEQAKGLGVVVAGACMIDGTTGEPSMLVQGEQLGEHARWVRALQDGSMLIASAEGVAKVGSTADGQAKVLWRTRDAELSYSVTGFVVGESLFVVDTDLKMWRVALSDGAFGAGSAIDTRERVSIPFEAHGMRDGAMSGLVITSSRGMVSLSSAGKLVGLDALQAAGRIEPGLVAKSLSKQRDVQPPMIVSVESGEQAESAVRVSSPSRVVFLRYPDLSLLAETKVGLPEAPTSLTLRDGLVIVGQEAGLVVLRAGAE